jgi:hypothetical protein
MHKGRAVNRIIDQDPEGGVYSRRQACCETVAAVLVDPQIQNGEERQILYSFRRFLG